MSVSYPSPAFAELLIALGSRPQERTRDELFRALGLDQEEYFLNRLVEADRALRECSVEVQPRLQDVPPDGVFLLRKQDAVTTSGADVRERLAAGETAWQEFKSTYWCDLRRRCHQPGATAKQLRSEDVKQSALRSIAGLLTTGGGTLFIGVSDSGDVLGLRPDLELLPQDRRNVDQLINNIKTDIAQRFRDGNTVNDYVRIEVVDVGDKQVLQLEVASRRALSFLASRETDYRLYRRQDNRTIPVKVYELEEFLALRRDGLLPSQV